MPNALPYKQFWAGDDHELTAQDPHVFGTLLLIPGALALLHLWASPHALFFASLSGDGCVSQIPGTRFALPYRNLTPRDHDIFSTFASTAAYPWHRITATALRGWLLKIGHHPVWHHSLHFPRIPSRIWNPKTALVSNWRRRDGRCPGTFTTYFTACSRSAENDERIQPQKASSAAAPQRIRVF